MNHITNFAESFMKLFQLGGETLSLSWEKRRSIPWLRFLPKILLAGI